MFISCSRYGLNKNFNLIVAKLDFENGNEVEIQAAKIRIAEMKSLGIITKRIFENRRYFKAWSISVPPF